MLGLHQTCGVVRFRKAAAVAEAAGVNICLHGVFPLMNPIIHGAQTKEEWRAGVVTRMRVSELTGSKELCIFEQWCIPGTGAPTHTHKVEEVLSVISGKVEIRLGDRVATLTQNESVIVPAGLAHGFRNIGHEELHKQAILASGHFEANPSPEGEPIVRWRPTSPD